MRFASLIFLLLAAPVVLAHGGAHGLMESGLAHPFTGLDHLATWLGLGAWLGCSAGLRWHRVPVAAPTLLIGALYWGLHAAALPQATPAFQIGNALGTLLLLAVGAIAGRRLARRLRAS